MAKSGPENDDHAGDTPSASGEGGREGEDSIEIVEVVGMDPDGAAKSGPVDPTPEPPDEDGRGESIPHSRKELFDMLLRKQAEFENVRKRLERDKQEIRQRIWMDLLGRFLPILDNFDRALKEFPSTRGESFHEGVALTVQQMKDLLRREGLEEIEATGVRFDPHIHEAVETRVVEGLEEGIVLEDLRKGYRFQGQLLRPTLVKVSAKGKKRREADA